MDRLYVIHIMRRKCMQHAYHQRLATLSPQAYRCEPEPDVITDCHARCDLTSGLEACVLIHRVLVLVSMMLMGFGPGGRGPRRGRDYKGCPLLARNLNFTIVTQGD